MGGWLAIKATDTGVGVELVRVEGPQLENK